MIRGLPGVMQKHYKQQVAKRLDVEIEDLEKTVKSENKAGVFLEKRLKKVKTEAPKNEALKKIENNLLALMVYGGVSGERVEIEIPEDEMKLKELELVFEKEYGGWDKTALEKEVAALEKRRKVEKNKAEIEALSAKLEEADEVESKKILEKIMALRKG